jgi:hypothetical protein
MIHFLKRRRRPIAIFLIATQLSQFVGMGRAFALTSGPTQPEVQAFQPAGTTEMVDLFSGDFGYNIPLFELPGPNGGYPFNLSYQAGATMDQEASFVGLGWSMNPGTINRQMRGLPDEFKGDEMKTKMSIAPNVTVGLGIGVDVEVFGGDIGLTESKGFSVYQNNYRGIGYAIDYSAGFSVAAGSSATMGLGVNLSVDSKEGVGISPSLSLGSKTNSVGLHAGYNSKDGLSSMTMSFSQTRDYTVADNARQNGEVTRRGTSFSASASISFAHPSYTPQISMPMKNTGLSTTFKLGGAWWGIYGDGYVTGFYNEQRLRHDGKWVSSGGYGYLNYQHATDDHALMDVNREKDGMVSTVTPNLPIPNLTYDIYSVTGQGISAMYRPMRNDIGVVRDQEMESVSIGGSAGVDVGIPAHLGINLNVNHARTTSGAWKDNNFFANRVKFQDETLNSDYEPSYFKVHGEPSVENSSTLKGIGGTDAMRIELSPERENPKATTFLGNDKSLNGTEIPEASAFNRERKSRNQVVQPITQEQLTMGIGENTEINPLFSVKYDSAGYEVPYKRNHKPHHTAGFTALTPEGLRYVYAIPAYNLTQEEVTFSAKKQAGDVNRVAVTKNNSNKKGDDDPDYDYSNTDKFLSRTRMPEFAHSYLLTAIVGPDYVDLQGDGVTTDDLGYWVKFTYAKTTTKKNPYKWRDPFTKAHYQEGWKTDPRDDRGAFVYGEKELWYLVKAETKSHIAAFTLKDRNDGRGAASFLQNTSSLGGSLKALSEISLYTRAAGPANPIKVVKLEHNYSLCPGVYNNGVSGGGKLTLKKLWFEYGGSQRGKLNPYIFDYHEDNANENPSYSPYDYDRWGNYKPNLTSDPLYNIDFPYDDQDPSRQADYDRNAAVWCLKEVKLPSGGNVLIDYETDDYAYVQHKQAMQMAKLVGPSGATGPSFNVNDSDLKIRFRLESPVPAASLGVGGPREVALQYLDQQRKEVYFKLKVNLRKANVEDFYEYVSGYADIDFEKAGGIGLEKENVGDSDYVYGFFTLKADKGYHPFSMRAWQHLRTNQPDLTNSAKPVERTDNTDERVKQIKGLGSLGAQVRRMFQGYFDYCKNNAWGREIVAEKSWVRLNSPDKKKYGGGLRVRQITMRDNWQYDQEGVYGQVYDYTIVEGKDTISSGVAAYEPTAGGDENALRYAKKFTESVPLRSDNNLFFEYPVNESYYPGAQVGYRKVTVTSLTAASLAAANNPRAKMILHTELAGGKKLFPTGDGKSFGTTGATIHEFYTAKDFPVMADETAKQDRPYNLSFTVPFLGSISVSKLSSSQGYSVVTNDMHGKLRQVTNFRQDRTGRVEEEPISWVRYNYAVDTIFYQQEKVLSLRNQFRENSDGTLTLLTTEQAANTQATFTLGQENEFIVDMREFDDNSYVGGLSYNTDIVYILFGVIPVPTSWPNVTASQKQLRTAVTNKVIFKSGVMLTTEAYDGGSRVVTQNVKWDKLTGTPVLTEVNNNFDHPVYSYSILAHKQYEGMGGAYQNIGLKFEISGVDNLPYHDHQYEFTVPANVKLFPGDEILLYKPGTSFTKPLAKVVYMGEEQGYKLMYSKQELKDVAYEAMISRSGYRNQLSVSAGSITALDDPTKPGTPKTYTKTITLPKP